MAGALIITAEMAAPDLAWLDRLRRIHYPAARNHVSAHLTIFHALPPTAEAEVHRTLSRAAGELPPAAMIEGVMDLGDGVAFRIVSDELDAVRAELASNFHGLLSSQDAYGWRPHVTIQNKVSPRVARALVAELNDEFHRRPLAIRGLGLYRYVDGPWEKVRTYAFRGR